jgi:hypothetical protein
MRYTIKTEHIRRHELSGRKVRCANTPNYGSDVRPGAWITYREEYTDGSFSRCVGRVLGRIEWAEPVSGDTRDVTGHLSVLAFADDFSHAYIRWIDPADVLTSREAPPAAMLAFAAGPLPTPDMVHRLSAYGTLSENYVANAAHHIEAFRLGVSPAAYDAGIRSVCDKCGRGIREGETHACPVFRVLKGETEIYRGDTYSGALKVFAENLPAGEKMTIMEDDKVWRTSADE